MERENKMAKKKNNINPENVSGKKTVQINSRAIIKYLFLFLALLIILSLTGQYLRVYTSYDEA